MSSGYEVVTLQDEKIVKRVSCDSRMDALKVEIAFNARDTQPLITAEARHNNLRIN
jgi:hypothetical protein